jgi:acetyl-CoA synthetase
MVRTTYGDHDRYKQAYFTTYPGYYFTGDGCKRDQDGDYRILGRVDDVINVSGHRLGTAEVEDAVCQNFMVNEAAVVGMAHEIKGQGIYAFVIKDPLADISEADLRKEILATVQQHIGGIAKPDYIQFVSGLPKTRSGKIMRRILRKIVEQDLSNLGDTSTLLDPNVVDIIVKGLLIGGV